jgi:hypothetical protein
MKKFILAMRDFKNTPKELKPKLVWNPNKLFLGASPYLVTYIFSKRTIETRGLEVIYG